MRVVGPRAMVSELLEAELPWSLEEAVRQQLEGLDHGRRRVAEALAVYGRAASFEALLVVTEADESDLLAALRALTAEGVVVEVSDDQFWFSHALVADAIVHQLLGRERRRLHERCFEAVRRAPMLDHASLAYHAQGADRHDEVPAIARRGAARYLEKGLTFSALRLAAEGLAEAPNDPELLAVATEAAWRLDFLAEALTTGVRWAKVAVEPLDRINALRFVARLHHELDDESASLARVGELEALWSSLDDPRLRGVAAWSLAQLHMIGGRDVDAVAWADQALVDARSVGDELTEARALVERAGAWVGRAAAAGVDRACSTTPSRRPAAAATPCCSPGRSTTASTCCRRTRTRRPRCGPRCRPSARASASTSSARRRRWRGSWRRRTRPATSRWCAGSPPRARSGGVGRARTTCGSRASTSASPSRRAASTTPAEAHAEFQAACSDEQAPALPAARDLAGRGARRAGGGRAAVRGPAAAAEAARHRDHAERHGGARRGPPHARHRAGRHPRADARRLARRAPVERRHPGPRRGAAGAGRGRRRRRPRRRSAPCWRAPIRASPSR